MKIYRYEITTRVAHWVHAVAMILLIVTGLQIYTGIGFMDSFTVPFHVTLGFVLVAMLIMELLSLLTHPKELKLSIPTITDIKNFVTIALNFMGLTNKYPAYHVYSKSKGYIRKWHPILKFIIWGDMFFVLLIAFTGFALYYPKDSALAWMTNYLDLGSIRTLHFLSFLYFVMTLIPHAYLALNPVNRGILKSMITGWDSGEDTLIVE